MGWIDWLLIYAALIFVFWFGWFMRGAVDVARQADDDAERYEQLTRREP